MSNQGRISSAVCSMLRAAPLQVVAGEEEVERLRQVRHLPDAPGKAGIGADDIVRGRELGMLGVVEDDHGRALDERLTRLADVDPVGEAGMDVDRVTRDHGHPHAGRRHAKPRQTEDAAGLLAHLDLLAGPPVVGQMPDHRQDIHGQRPGEDALTEFVLDESADVAGPLPQRAVPGHDLDLVIEARDPLAAQPGGGLEGGDDEFLELPAGVQRGQGVDHRHDRRPRIGDDPQRPVLGPLRVDSVATSGTSEVAPEDRGVVDDDNTSPRGIPNPVVDHGRGMSTTATSTSSKNLGQRLDDQITTADRDRLADVLTRGGQFDPVPHHSARRQHLEQDSPDGAGAPDDGKRHGARQLCGGGHHSGNARAQRPVPA